MSARRRERRTTRAQLLLLHRHLVTVSLGILRKKNADYGAAADALHNFRVAALVAGTTDAQAVVARLTDKIGRLGRAAAGHALRVQEEDIPDAINLLVLLAAALRERRRRR